jgi:hypothetical protein
MKLEFCLQTFEKYSNIKFNENPSSGSRAVPCGLMDGRTDGQTDRQTDMVQLIVAFCNCTNAPKRITAEMVSRRTAITILNLDSTRR